MSFASGVTVMEKWEILVEWVTKVCLRLLTHAGLVRQNVLIPSEVFLYVERSKNLEKKYVITVQKIHLPKVVRKN